MRTNFAIAVMTISFIAMATMLMSGLLGPFSIVGPVVFLPNWNAYWIWMGLLYVAYVVALLDVTRRRQK